MHTEKIIPNLSAAEFANFHDVIFMTTGVV